MDKTIRNMDWLLFGSLMGLAIVGMFALDMSADQAPPETWINQKSFVIAGLLGFILICFVPLQIIERMSWPLYAIALLLLMLLLPFGEEYRGAIRWFDSGFVKISPAEIIKWMLMLALARWFAIRDTGDVFGKAVPVLAIILPMGLIFLQPDFGETLQLLMIAMIIVAAAKQWHFLAIMMTTGTAFVGFLWFIVMHDYQKSRLLTYVGMNFDPEAGYGVLRFSDVGLFEGAIVALLLVFAIMLIARLLMTTYRAKNQFALIVSVGVSSMVTLFITLNIAILSGFMHAYLILRPLISYHEVALMLMITAMGLIMRIPIESKKNTDSSRRRIK